VIVVAEHDTDGYPIDDAISSVGSPEKMLISASVAVIT
jgi:hypothetical protein